MALKFLPYIRSPVSNRVHSSSVHVRDDDDDDSLSIVDCDVSFAPFAGECDE